jgi:glycosyltransferase involved in cell wall biosynthesis
VSPRISVLMPTHDRVDQLQHTLEALEQQTTSPEMFEVVLVADGCTDRTAGYVASTRFRFRLTFLEQDARGAAAARNVAARHARAPLLLLLDDDKEAAPGLIEAHLRMHESYPGSVVLGYYPIPAASAGRDPSARWAKQWWDGAFQEVSQPDHRFTFKDFCSGNTSLSSALFMRAGGFDESFPGAGGEDWEFGIRLLQCGAGFRFCREALSLHRERMDFLRAKRRAQAEGYAHVLIARKNPELFWAFRLHEMSRLQSIRPLWRFLWRRPGIADGPAALISGLMRVTSRLGLRGLTQRLSSIAMGHAYWRGACAAGGSLQAFEDLVEDAPLVPESENEVSLDLVWGLEELEKLAALHPASVRVYAKGEPLGRVWPKAGAEPMRACHIRRELMERFSGQLLGALVERATAFGQDSESTAGASRAHV